MHMHDNVMYELMHTILILLANFILTIIESSYNVIICDIASYS